ncbi:hypothetical protein P171DRAFT_229199 [Karstenula rhodostoma CBS 690.94]|uniref:Uncharacterized protein n=1 Tax=Karstenula rhodostoma CBS 690.94 TaxID=1392251 RepID=A0A9P4PRP5_9PLEO|nr:hypothetical protein P171DRAFT_229199 [Karstenula rhodostoma CBS 690.94]
MEGDGICPADYLWYWCGTGTIFAGDISAGCCFLCTARQAKGQYLNIVNNSHEQKNTTSQCRLCVCARCEVRNSTSSLSISFSHP